MAVFNRKTHRAKIAADLSTLLSTTAAVYGYMPPMDVFDAQTLPVVAINSTNTSPNQGTPSMQDVFFSYDVLIAVRADPDAGWTAGSALTWGPDDAANAIDDIEATIRDYVNDNQVLEGYWGNLELTGASDVIDQTVESGRTYKTELMRLTTHKAGTN